MAATLSIPFARTESGPGVLQELSRDNWNVVGMTTSRDAPPLRQIAADVSTRPFVVVVGHEGDGLSNAALDACTHRARIPMTNTVDSLNVATAAAIALYELSRAG